MAYSFDSAKQLSLQSRSMQEVAKLCWGDFVLMTLPQRDRRNSSDFLYQEKIQIIAHRKTVVKTVTKTFSSCLSKRLFDVLVDAVIRIQRGYHEALIIASHYIYTARYKRGDTFIDCIKLKVPHALIAGPYSAKNFIDLTTGHFDELTWAQGIVNDKNQSESSRFELACHYCFEETIYNMFYVVRRRLYTGNFDELVNKHGCLVAVWVCKLENKFDKNSEFVDHFHAAGFRVARKKGIEHASIFFWNQCSDAEKADLMREITQNFNELTQPAHLGYAGYVNFIYSILSLEQKRELIESNIKGEEYSTWTCLLLSQFYEPVLNDMLTLPFPTSNKSFAFILTRLIAAMVELPLPECKKIFEALWKPLSLTQRREILELDTGVITNLTILKDMDLFETVIRPFPPDIKAHMLVFNWCQAGMWVLNQFSKGENYAEMLRYMLIFLVDPDPITPQILRVRADAAHLLERFKISEVFIQWTTSYSTKTERKEFNKVIENLQGSLRVLNILLDWVKMTI